jgi:hypothetical protein
MEYLKLTLTILLFAMQYSATAQDINNFREIKCKADSVTTAKELSKSEAIYLKALEISGQDPVLPKNLASLYLRMSKTVDADKYIKLAILNGADMDMLLADKRIGCYLKIHPEKDQSYAALSKQHKLFMQINNRNKWIDDHRRAFNERSYYR